MKGKNKTNVIIAIVLALTLVILSGCTELMLIAPSKYRINANGRNYYCNSYTITENQCIIVPGDSCGCASQRGPIEICSPYIIYSEQDGVKIEEEHQKVIINDEDDKPIIEDPTLDDAEDDFVDTTDYSI